MRGARALIRGEGGTPEGGVTPGRLVIKVRKDSILQNQSKKFPFSKETAPLCQWEKNFFVPRYCIRYSNSFIHSILYYCLYVVCPGKSKTNEYKYESKEELNIYVNL